MRPAVKVAAVLVAVGVIAGGSTAARANHQTDYRSATATSPDGHGTAGGASPQDGKLKTIAKGNVSKDCCSTGQLYKETRGMPGSTFPIQVTIENTGDCDVTVWVNGNAILTVPPGTRARAGANIVNPGTVGYECARTDGKCVFEWRVRG